MNGKKQPFITLHRPSSFLPMKGESNFQSIGLSEILYAWRQNLFFIKLLNKRKYHSAYAEL